MADTKVETEAADAAGSPKGKRKKKGASLSIAAINLRISKIQHMEDGAKSKRSRRKLVHRVVKGIADGAVRQPTRAAQALLAIMPEKEEDEDVKAAKVAKRGTRRAAAKAAKSE